MPKMPKYSADYYLDSVGRRRKLSHGAMQNIQRAYADGESTADLAEQYGVSVSLIRTVTYLTARKTDPIIPGLIHRPGLDIEGQQ
jgi:hypothetical protein